LPEAKIYQSGELADNNVYGTGFPFKPVQITDPCSEVVRNEIQHDRDVPLTQIDEQFLDSFYDPRVTILEEISRNPGEANIAGCDQASDPPPLPGTHPMAQFVFWPHHEPTAAVEIGGSYNIGVIAYCPDDAVAGKSSVAK